MGLGGKAVEDVFAVGFGVRGCICVTSVRILVLVIRGWVGEGRKGRGKDSKGKKYLLGLDRFALWPDAALEMSSAVFCILNGFWFLQGDGFYVFFDVVVVAVREDIHDVENSVFGEGVIYRCIKPYTPPAILLLLDFSFVIHSLVEKHMKLSTCIKNE